LARLEIGHTGTDRDDLTRNVAPRDNGKLKSQHSLEISAAYLPINWIHTCCRNLHKDLTRSGRRRRHFLIPELLYTSVPIHLYGFHGGALLFDLVPGRSNCGPTRGFDL
jgi:hypothetical protein